MSYQLFGMENPLLDIQCTATEELLNKYSLKANNAILADESHKALYDEIIEKFNVVYVAGGATQNTIRGAQYLLPPNSTVYTGCVSDDKFAETMKAAAAADGLRTEYQITKEAPTGTCAVLITGHHRSLVANLAAAEKFKYELLRQPENWKNVENAKYYYVGAFFLSHDGGYESALAVSKYAAENNKVFAMNLSAPFLAQFFKDRLDSVIKNTDILFGNEDEARVYSKEAKWDTDDVKEIAKKLSQLEKSNSRPRIVVLTQGAEETVVAVGDQAYSFPVTKVEDKDIVDCNGAGDAFCGGFMGLYAQGVEEIPRLVNAGHYLAHLVIKRVGPTYPTKEEREALPEF
ncbi:Ribokinase-like protein [Radiomyces spectabilis]|uniref:Ribokinase-like protein n=1 Tax=Radiomyces spectabilis TaxID=64574 RepID=UPI00221F7661|nr:Ribokinase-like protein [Radiomyces spectabilis]KAI8384289.1 Ribokinase-like protein [Radiomyces spectabilis]